MADSSPSSVNTRRMAASSTANMRRTMGDVSPESSLPCPAGVSAQSPDHDANGRGGTGDQPGNAAASRRRVALAPPGRSAVQGLADRLWLALQVQQYHPGRVTDRVLPSTRETVTIVSGCMQQPQVVHFIGQDLLWHRPSDLGGKFGTNKEPQASRADQRRARLAAKA